MKHGKRHQVEVGYSLPEWKVKFLRYKTLKRRVKIFQILTTRRNNNYNNNNLWVNRVLRNHINSSIRGFTRLLDYELEKVNDFFVDKEEDYVIRLKELQIKVGNLESNEEKLRIQKDIIDFHAEMVLLLHYCVLNFTGLIKIVKKHNKQVDGISIPLPSTPRVTQQPFFSTELLYNLMKDCQQMLHGLSVANQPSITPPPPPP